MKPLLITQGDVAGIGPEVIGKAFAHGQAHGAVVLGDAAVMRRALAAVGAHLPVVAVRSPGDAVPAGVVPVLAVPGLPDDLHAVPLGRIDARAGEGAAACIREAVRLVQAGEGRAIVTAPIHKEALAAAGVPHPGHTEMLQALAAAPGEAPPPVRMMLASDELRTVLVTIHMSLRRAIDAVTHDAVLETVRIAHASLRRMGIAAPRIAVAGLNPHAGEGGLFGHEDVEIIAPAIAAARRDGIDATGPHPPDTVFMRARDTPDHPGAFDIVVAMTHDHGLIPVKYLGVEHGVNVTLGLPFVRTSPDHGTAFDIAGTGQADSRSFEAALALARRLAL